MTVPMSCSIATLQEVFGEGDATRRRAAIEELYTEDCVLYVPPGVFVTTLSTIRGGSSRDDPHFVYMRTANLRLSTTPVVWLGDLARAAKHPPIRVWM